MNYKLTKKINEKWLTFFSYEPKNKYDKKQVTINLKLLREALAGKDDYLNLAVFEDKPKPVEAGLLKDEIPF